MRVANDSGNDFARRQAAGKGGVNIGLSVHGFVSQVSEGLSAKL
jgi:hypothetical protein